MTPQEFIRKWKPVALTERAAAQEHFLDLCRVFDHPTPAEADPTGETFAFEKGVGKTGGGDGYADVWKKGFFAWEYKKKKHDLNKALEQLTRYAAALENPPLHVVCDTHLFRVETRWTNEVPAKYQFDIDDFAEPQNLEILRNVFHNPEKLRSGRDRRVLTKEAADKFQAISDSLQHRFPDREAVAHFVNQLVFCFFADGVELLPKGLWRKLIESCDRRPERSRDYLKKLFDEMKSGGEFDLTDIAHFNGGLFDGRDPLRLEHTEIGQLYAAARLDWSLIDPTIFGTLFERFLDPDKRAQIGAHYTDPEKIMMIVDPVIARPLQREWAEAKAAIEAIMAPVSAGAVAAKKFEAARAKAEARRDAFIDRLGALRILDPACGSGNFLYLALQTVKDIENRALLDGVTLGLRYALPRVGPEILHGLEINPFAAELARTTIWIGDIQWRVKNGVSQHPRPILKNLNSIECRDALLTAEGKEAEWPEADYIVGNPPFLGAKLMRQALGQTETEQLRQTYAGRISPFSDLVCWWFDKARAALLAGRARAAGLVATNSIRGGRNRLVLDSIARDSRIFEAWSDEPWVVDGASVRVSVICFGSVADAAVLNGKPVAEVNADLTAGNDLTAARRLDSNNSVSFVGLQKSGPFDIPGAVARSWLTAPLNPSGRPNSDVLQPHINGLDVVRHGRDQWIINFEERTEAQSALFELPFEYALAKVKPFREKSAISHFAWWQLWRIRPELTANFGKLSRVISTPEVAKHRVFVWVPKNVSIDKNLTVVARDDDTTFGILHSRFHEAWSLRLGTWLGVGNDPRYTPTTTFETFPFPEGLTPNLPASSYADDPRAKRIAVAAKKLDDLRRGWLNPPDLVEIVPEVTPTAAPGEAPRKYPDRILPKNVAAAAKLKERTLTSLYNQRPRWLADAHEALDRAVAAAYGWPEDISTEEALSRLLALNLQRAKETPSAVIASHSHGDPGGV